MNSKYGDYQYQSIVSHLYYPPDKDFAEVLLVDDNPSNLELLEDLFTRVDIKPTLAYSGKEALKKLGRFDKGFFDLVITDLRMPSMTGYQLIDEIYNAGHTPKTCISSADFFDTSTIDPNPRVDLRVAKPYDCNQILAFTERLLPIDWVRITNPVDYPMIKVMKEAIGLDSTYDYEIFNNKHY